jgi:hypothetical protein
MIMKIKETIIATIAIIIIVVVFVIIHRLLFKESTTQ